MSTQFNPIISGVSVSGDLSTESTTLRIEMGNSDKIGHVNFVLQNSQGQYSKTLFSGNAQFEIDAVTNGVASVLMKGTLEKVVPEVDLKSNKGSIATFDGYDHGQELMEVMSPDTRPPYLVYTPTSGAQSGVTQFFVTSGDGGLASEDGLDLVLYTSGVSVNLASNLISVTVAQFMSQWFGTSGDHTGSASGMMFSFKPYTPGYTWTTYYTPDSSGGVAANDNNNNYYIYQDKLKAKREYAWDTLKKITRQGVAVDGLGNPAPYEVYVDTVGAIHLYTSGSTQLVASGVSLIYYPAGQSGASNNNILTAQVPYDLTQIKNVVEGWFQDWTQYPYDGELWTSFVALSGGYWVASNSGFLSMAISGGPPAGSTGNVSIQVSAYSGASTNSWTLRESFSIFSGATVNVAQWNVVESGGVGSSVNLTWSHYFTVSGGSNQLTGSQINVYLFDLSGHSSVATGANAVNNISQSGWGQITVVVFGSGGSLGQFTSGVNFNAVAAIAIEQNISYTLGGKGYNVCMGIDNLAFTFDYPFSPVVGFNSGSQGLYGRRYGDVEWPYEVSAGASSGIIFAALNNTLAPQGVATFLIKDNPALPFSAQTGIKNGQIFVVDSPYFNCGSGQFFYYWRAISITHNWDKNQNGFETTITAVPWYSGIITVLSGGAQTNSINAQQPMLYQNIPQPSPEAWQPMGRPWITPGR